MPSEAAYQEVFKRLKERGLRGVDYGAGEMLTRTERELWARAARAGGPSVLGDGRLVLHNDRFREIYGVLDDAIAPGMDLREVFGQLVTEWKKRHKVEEHLDLLKLPPPAASASGAPRPMIQLVPGGPR